MRIGFPFWRRETRIDEGPDRCGRAFGVGWRIFEGADVEDVFGVEADVLVLG